MTTNNDIDNITKRLDKEMKKMERDIKILHAVLWVFFGLNFVWYIFRGDLHTSIWVGLASMWFLSSNMQNKFNKETRKMHEQFRDIQDKLIVCYREQVDTLFKALHKYKDDNEELKEQLAKKRKRKK